MGSTDLARTIGCCRWSFIRTFSNPNSGRSVRRKGSRSWRIPGSAAATRESQPSGVNQTPQSAEKHPFSATLNTLTDPRARSCRLSFLCPSHPSLIGRYSGTSFPLVGDGPFQCASGGATLLKNAVVNEIAAKLAKSPAQILIRWSVQSGAICIPKSVKPERIAENHDVYGWEIPADDMAALSALNCGFRYGIGYCPGELAVIDDPAALPHDSMRSALLNRGLTLRVAGHFDCPNAPWGADGTSQ